MQVGRV